MAEFVGVERREGDEVPKGETIVIRVMMRPTGWTVDVTAEFRELIALKMPGYEKVCDSLVEVVTSTMQKLKAGE